MLSVCVCQKKNAHTHTLTKNKILGGGQERGIRSGTVPHFLCVGFGAACEVAEKEMGNDSAWVRHLSERLMHGIQARIPDVILNGDAPADAR